MRYLIIDGCLGGTGIRDEIVGGYIRPSDLGLMESTVSGLAAWLAEYEMEHYAGYSNVERIETLDTRGKAIAKTIKEELLSVRVSYYSDAKLTTEILP